LLAHSISVYAQDLPEDRTGELHNLLSFIHNNLDLCKWVALAIFATQVFSSLPSTLLISAECPRLITIPNRSTMCDLQALSLFLAMILRAMLSARTTGYDSDEDFVVIRRPLLLAQAPPPYLPTTVDTRGFRPDLWSSRMRQKVTTHTYIT
jgi:hypothetical protein